MRWKFCVSLENCHVGAHSKYGFVERAKVSQILGHSTPEAMETGALWAWCGAAIQERPPRIQSAPADRARANGWGAWSPRPLFAILIWFGGKPKNHCGHLTRHTFMFDELTLKLSSAALSVGPVTPGEIRLGLVALWATNLSVKRRFKVSADLFSVSDLSVFVGWFGVTS